MLYCNRCRTNLFFRSQQIEGRSPVRHSRFDDWRSFRLGVKDRDERIDAVALPVQRQLT
jgi:hypothetical protein